MGCDIHSYAERREGGRWVELPKMEPFGEQSYNVFGWLAGVRNYSAVAPISEPRGLPADMSAATAKHYDDWRGAAHSESWLTVAELLCVDYEQEVEDRRTTKELGPGFWSGRETCAAGEGHKQTLREFLGRGFFDDLKKLQDAGAERVVFWFDN